MTHFLTTKRFPIVYGVQIYQKHISHPKRNPFEGWWVCEKCMKCLCHICSDMLILYLWHSLSQYNLQCKSTAHFHVYLPNKSHRCSTWSHHRDQEPGLKRIGREQSICECWLYTDYSKIGFVNKLKVLKRLLANIAHNIVGWPIIQTLGLNCHATYWGCAVGTKLLVCFKTVCTQGLIYTAAMSCMANHWQWWHIA